MNSEKEILITGGTGSLGKALTKVLLEEYGPKGIRIFSRDELKQWEMRTELQQKYKKLPVSFLVGDVRDRKRLELATKGVHIIIHAAALKQIPSCEANPLEAINTNIIGAQNVLMVALENKVEKVLAISSDKACYPINLYGATKLASEKLFIQGNAYSGGRNPRFSCVRYGNVVGSRGSIVPLFKKQYSETGKITITDEHMTRFWITLSQVSHFILQAIEDMKGEEIFIPKMASATVLEIAKGICPDAEIEIVGIRPGEKLHETLITKEESLHTEIKGNRFEIANSTANLKSFEYRSDNNPHWLTQEQIKEMVETHII